MSNWDGWRDYAGPVKEQRQPMRAGVPGAVAGGAPTAAKRQKYGAVPTVVDGIRFDSKKEAARWVELKQLEQAGQIQALQRQPEFPLCMWRPDHSDIRPVAVYRADFAYTDLRTNTQVIEDVKGMKTPVYRLKKKMVESQYDVRIVEV